MKKNAIITVTVICVAIAALIIFSKLTSRKTVQNNFAEARKGIFEITVANAGELVAERSIDIKGPELGQRSDRGGGRQGGDSRGGRGNDMRFMDFKIQDIVPEGTVVKEGDYIAQLDKTNYDNTLKDELESLKTQQASLEMKILDTAVVLTNLRDEIKNQRYQVEEAVINLEQSKYEPPATIRQAETNLNRQQRALEQNIKNYELIRAKTFAEINHEKMHLDRQERLVSDLQEFLAKFTVIAPSPGMVIYKKDRNGNKRKIGSSVNPFDRIIATLPDLSTMISKVYVNEIEVSKVMPGQKVIVTIDAFPQKSYTGNVISVGNIGEQLPNSDAKMFEVQIRIDGSDQDLRPAMTTWNKIILKTIADAVYIPLECVQAGADSIPFVYKKNKTKQIVELGEQDEKNVIVKRGLEPGANIFIIPPEDHENFRLVGENLIPGKKE
ncbi:MAG: efflux RND transporter periplasmic adaptor subunit [Bacteroidales bacterium]|jgi:multidrug efflux pump subunit AcrA (membrane-fusion protein)|nr:efflux RND transporter periplasmic adaptor subunit [Bacteroidales bacterium]